MANEIQSIAQGNYILSTQQEVAHDNTLSGNGTVESPLGVVPGYNETVLYSNLTDRPTTVGSYIDLSESPLNFTEIAIYLNGSAPTGSNNLSNGYEKVPVEQLSSSNGLQFVKEFAGVVGGSTSTVFDMGCGYSGTSGTRWTKWYGYSCSIHDKIVNFNNNIHLNIWKVVGINRISANS